MGRLIGLKRSDFQKDSHVVLNRTLTLDNILNDTFTRIVTQLVFSIILPKVLDRTLSQWDFSIGVSMKS